MNKANLQNWRWRIGLVIIGTLLIATAIKLVTDPSWQYGAVMIALLITGSVVVFFAFIVGTGLWFNHLKKVLEPVSSIIGLTTRIVLIFIVVLMTSIGHWAKNRQAAYDKKKKTPRKPTYVEAVIPATISLFFFWAAAGGRNLSAQFGIILAGIFFLALTAGSIFDTFNQNFDLVITDEDLNLDPREFGMLK